MANIAHHAKATATVLHEEFRVPFCVFDAATATRLWPPVEANDEIGLSSDNVGRFATLVGGRQVQVARMTGHKLRLRVPLVVGDTTLIAEAVLLPLANSPEGVAQEESRLERWAQAVLDRLLQANQIRALGTVEDDLKRQVKNAWELNLTLERLIRHMRINREPNTNIPKILEAALPFLAAQMLVWIPANLEVVHVRGYAPLADDDARDLIKALRRLPELHESGMLLCHRVAETSWGANFPFLRNLLAMTVGSGRRSVSSGNSCGWIIAINTRSATTNAELRNADAAALAPFAALIGLFHRASDRYLELKDLLVGLTRSLASAVDAKDPYTYGHSERVARIAVELGREMKLGEDELSDLYLAGLLHDVGKIGIRDDVLCKHGPLTPEETEHMQQHPEIGHAILKDLKQINSLLPGVLHHHERYDGRGYPAKLVGEQIPRIARILAVADSYDAMSTCRPYRKGLLPEHVDEILLEGSGTQWDPRVIEAFQTIIPRLRSIRECGLGESLRQALDGALRDSGSSQIAPSTTL